MRSPTITLYSNDPMGKRWLANAEAASRAEAELGAEVIVVRKTSPAYRPGVDPPCPSVAVGDTIIVRDGVVTLEQLRDALLAARG